LDAALGYSLLGWRIIPLHSFVDGCCTCEQATCGSPAKHPLTANGVHDATTDEKIIRRWWAETQGIANVGIATGADSGLVVLDVDAKSGGQQSLANLEQTHGRLPLTPTASTGGGGAHYYFRCPKGTSVGNRRRLCRGRA
jgi:putative DNA primase/helicase